MTSLGYYSSSTTKNDAGDHMRKILKTFLSVQCVDAVLNTTLVIVIWENYEKFELHCDYHLLIGKKFHLDE